MSETGITLGAWTQRPLSHVAPEVQGFWSGLLEHEFRLCTCVRCGSRYWPYTLCDHHEGFVEFDEMQWRPASGRGTVFAKLVVHRVTDAAYASEVPYVLALIELEEGPLFPGRVIVDDPHDVKIGDPVRVTFYDVAEPRQTFPLFVPSVDREA